MKLLNIFKKKKKGGPEIYVTPNGRRYIKARELMESPRFKQILSHMKGFPGGNKMDKQAIENELGAIETIAINLNVFTNNYCAYSNLIDAVNKIRDELKLLKSESKDKQPVEDTIGDIEAVAEIINRVHEDYGSYILLMGIAATLKEYSKSKSKD